MNFMVVNRLDTSNEQVRSQVCIKIVFMRLEYFSLEDGEFSSERKLYKKYLIVRRTAKYVQLHVAKKVKCTKEESLIHCLKNL